MPLQGSWPPIFDPVIVCILAACDTDGMPELPPSVWAGFVEALKGRECEVAYRAGGNTNEETG